MKENIVKIWTMCMLMLVSSQMWAQQSLSQLEYWFDLNYEDHQTITLSGSQTDISTDIATDGLTFGLHRLHFRTKNSEGEYSGITTASFFKTNHNNGNQLEYWVDDDYVNHGYVEIAGSSATFNITSHLSMSGATAFADGSHRLNYRVITANGNYGPVNTAIIINRGVGSTTGRLEFWFDGDYKNRKSLELKGKERSFELSEMLDLSELQRFQLGIHKLNYRVVLPGGNPTPINSVMVMNTGGGGEPDKLEYWLDNDKEHSKFIEGTKIGDGIYSIVGKINLATLAKGFHQLNFRATSAQGHSSAVYTNFIVNTGSGSAPNRVEYWLDGDYRSSRFIEGTQSSDSIYTIAGGLDLSDAPAGFHRLFYRTTSQNGQNLGPVNVAHIVTMGGEKPSIEYWFDDNKDDIRTIDTEQYGNEFIADEAVDVSDISVGMHMLNYRVSSPGHRYASAVNSAAVVIMPNSDFFTRQNQTIIASGIYWVDDEPAKEFVNFEPGEIVDIEELINLADLEDGKHVFSMRFVDSNGKWTDVDKTVFTKRQFNETEIIAGILYRYREHDNEAYVAAIGYEQDITEANILETVDFGGQEYVVKEIEEKAFYGSDAMSEIVTIPASVERIGSQAFAASAANEVNLKASAAPVLGDSIFPAGTNIRVPLQATGYDALSTKFEREKILLTFDLGCIYDAQWNALKRIDAMISAHGGATNWDFTDRTSTPTGVKRWGTDHVYEIDLSNHELTGEYTTADWVTGLPRISRINLSGNSIMDMTGKDGYAIMQLDSQRYDLVIDVHLGDPETASLFTPAVPLIFRNASTGNLGNRNLVYGLNTKCPDGSYVDEWQQDYGMLLTVTPDGEVTLAQDNGNETNIYRGQSGQMLSIISSGINTITPGSYFRMRLYFDEGDVNLDGLTDISDLQKIINYIFDYGTKSHIFAWHAANLADTDEIINVMDVVGMVDILLSQTPELTEGPQKAMARSYGSGITETDATLALTDRGLILTSGHDVAAIDVVMTRGADLTALKRMGLTISRKDLDSEYEHIVAYSLDGSSIPAGEHTIATKTEGKQISAAALVDIESNRLNTVILTDSSATGIDEINTSQENCLYDLNGRRVDASYRGITIENGKIRMTTKQK